jgi:hypothetical protein
MRCADVQARAAERPGSLGGKPGSIGRAERERITRLTSVMGAA